MTMGAQTAWLTDGGIVFDAIQAKQDFKASTVSMDSRGPASYLPTPLTAVESKKPESQTIDRLVFSENFLRAACCSKIEGKARRAGIYQPIEFK